MAKRKSTRHSSPSYIISTFFDVYYHVNELDLDSIRQFAAYSVIFIIHISCIFYKSTHEQELIIQSINYSFYSIAVLISTISSILWATQYRRYNTKEGNTLYLHSPSPNLNLLVKFIPLHSILCYAMIYGNSGILAAFIVLGIVRCTLTSELCYCYYLRGRNQG